MVTKAFYGVIIVILSIRLMTFYQQPQVLEDGQQLLLQTRLAEEPQIVNGRMEFRVRTEKGQRIKIITGLHPQWKYGDELAIKGKVKVSEKHDTKFFTMIFPSLQIASNDQNIISQVSTNFRRKATLLYGKSLPPASAGLLNGIVFGGRQDLPKEFMEDLRISGVVHVIAASGMNVTFVAGALLGVLGHVFRRRVALTIAIFGILFYLFLTGFEPSIVRASIMSILAFSASILGRQSFAVGSLFLTGFVMLFVSPHLLTDIGFQLSFLATAGILFVKPLLDGAFGKLGRLGRVGKDDLGTTISAQIATVPVLLGVFGQYGLLSVLVNALVLWTVPILMVIGAVGLLVGLVFEPLGRAVIFLAAPILFYFEKVVSFFGSLGWTLSMPQLSNAIWIGYYLLLSAIILLLRSRKDTRING